MANIWIADNPPSDLIQHLLVLNADAEALLEIQV